MFNDIDDWWGMFYVHECYISAPSFFLIGDPWGTVYVYDCYIRIQLPFLLDELRVSLFPFAK